MPMADPPPALVEVHPRHLLLRLSLAAAAFLLIGVAVAAWQAGMLRGTGVSTTDAYLRADVTPLAAKVEGYVRAVPVVDNQRVSAGDLLLEINPDDYAAQVDQAAALAEAGEKAIAAIDQQKELQRTLVEQAQATIAATMADVTRYNLEAERQRSLLHAGGGLAGTRQAVEQAEAADQRANATLALNQAQLRQQQLQIDLLDAQQAQARATLKAQQAALRLARITLGYTRITAPADGNISERSVKPGQFVRDGSQIMTLVPSATIWAVANFKETQLTHMRVGDPARIIVDAFPDRVLLGKVESFSPASGAQFALLPPDNSTGNFTKVVQRVPVKITFETEPSLAGLLRPGMSVTVTVDARPR